MHTSTRVIHTYYLLTGGAPAETSDTTVATSDIEARQTQTIALSSGAENQEVAFGDDLCVLLITSDRAITVRFGAEGATATEGKTFLLAGEEDAVAFPSGSVYLTGNADGKATVTIWSIQTVS